jgi:hypothetical protein
MNDLSDDTIAFPRITEFAYCIMSLPHSMASVDRLFSTSNLNKTGLFCSDLKLKIDEKDETNDE